MIESGTFSPETIARHQKIADTLLLQATKPREIRGKLQGLGQLGESALAGWMGYRADEEDKAAQKDALTAALAAFGGGGTAPGGMPMSAPPRTPAGPAPVQVVAPEDFNSIDAMASPAGKFDPNYQGTLGAANRAVGTVESGGNYSALGPETGGDRAFGKHQVMGKNVGPWTEEVLGKRMDPQSFLANPDAQDAVFNAKFGGNVQKYGNVADPASIWFSGKPMAQAGNARDVLGTTVPGYVQKVAGALNNGGGASMASAAPQTTAGPPGGNAAAIAAILNPRTPPALAAALAQQMNPSYGFQTLPDGTILRTNPKNGTVEPIYSAPVKPELKSGGTDPITGQISYQVFDPKSQTMKPVGGGAGDAPTGMPGVQSGMLAKGVTQLDHSLTGEDYLKQFGPEVQAAVKSYMNGDVMPSGNPRLQSLANTAKTIAQKYGQDMGIPVSDATYSQRRTYRSQLGSNSPASAGGQAKAFNQGIEHMGHLADTLEKLDNSSGLGIPIVASAMNAGRQAISTEQSAVSDKAASIGQTLAGEVGKLFSGSAGGGVHERELTRDRFSTVKSPVQLAAALEGTLEMMQGGLTALEQRRNEVMGENSGIRFVNPETEKKIASIRQTIDRLKGGAPAPAAGGSPAAGGLPPGWSVQVH